MQPATGSLAEPPPKKAASTLHKGNRMSKFTAVAVALAVAGISASAFAQDGKVYPATICEGSLVGNPPIISYTGKSVRNNSTANSAVLACPIIKDDVYSVSGLSQVHVRYCKATSSGFNSSLYSYSAYGTSSFLSSKWDFGPAGCNKVLSHGPISSYSTGYYSLLLVLPPSTAATSPKTEVFSFRADEV